MSTRLGFSVAASMDRLQTAPFVPVKTEKDVRLFRPSEVYFAAKDGNNNLYGAAFTFVDFGERANVFLRYCGVRSEPSVKGSWWSQSIPANNIRHRQIVDAGAATDVGPGRLAGKVSLKISWRRDPS